MDPSSIALAAVVAVLVAAVTLAVRRERSAQRERILAEALDVARRTLEEKVRERTADLTRAYGELKSLDAAKDVFISSVSHELRTPLSSIRAFSEILLDYGDADQETRREFLQIINRESERLSRLVNDILDLSRMEAGKLDLRLGETDLREIVAHALESAGVLAAGAVIVLDSEMPDDLPPILADSDRIVQVMTNLLGNAVKFTPSGGRVKVAARVIPGKRRDDPEAIVEVRVSDTGVGIPKETIPAIFDKFKQLGDGLTGKSKGSGLGLPICREIIQLHGGRIWVESVPGQGSTFAFTLPAAGASPRALSAAGAAEIPGLVRQTLVMDLPPAASQGSGAPAPAAADRRRCVAVVDDDPALVEVVAESLRARGFEVLEGGDGIDALDLLKARSVDLLILDLQMPKISGWQVLETLRSDPLTHDLPVIVLTGWAEEGDRIRAFSLGVVEYLMKGQGLSRLCAEIEIATGRSSPGDRRTPSRRP